MPPLALPIGANGLLLTFFLAPLGTLPSDSGPPAQQAIGIEQGSGRHVAYYINRSGQAIAAGDLIIGRHVAIQRHGIAPLKTTPASRHAGTERAWGQPASYWPGNRVYYTFEGIRPASREQVCQAMRHIETHSAVRFIARTTERDYIVIRNHPERQCLASALGRQGQRQILAFSTHPGCNRMRVTLHGLMHVLGAGHAYLRPDRDRFIRITRPDYTTRINPHLDTRHPFDYASVTNHPHLFRAVRTEHQPLITDNDHLSEGDIRFLRQAYSSG